MSSTVALGCATMLMWPPSVIGAEAGSISPPQGGPNPAPVVVHFGDSFVNAGLQQNLRPKFHAAGARYIALGKTSSWLTTWAHGPDLDDLFYAYRPALFLVTLGANDLLFKPVHKRAHQVHRIVERMHGRPCVWISVPLWEGAPDDLMQMIRQECAPCRFYDSSVINPQITRQEDKRHPDDNGGAVWANAFWDWLQQERDPSGGGWVLRPAPPDEHAPGAARADERR